MTEVLLALLVGLIVGAIFGGVGIVPPAPPTWAGVAGIVGIVAAWQAVSWLMEAKGWAW